MAIIKIRYELWRLCFTGAPLHFGKLAPDLSTWCYKTNRYLKTSIVIYQWKVNADKLKENKSKETCDNKYDTVSTQIGYLDRICKNFFPISKGSHRYIFIKHTQMNKKFMFCQVI